MNVLYLTHRLPYLPNRGDRIRAYYMLRQMATFARVSLFSFVHDEEEAAWSNCLDGAADVEICRVDRVRNLVRGAVSLPSSRPLTHALLDASNAHDQLGTMVRRSRPDVVVAYCSGMARFALEPPLAGLPLVVDLVDVDSDKWARLSTSSGWPRAWIYKREARTLGAFEAKAAQVASDTLVVNDRERQALLALAPAVHVSVVSNGIDVEKFRPTTPPAREPVVSFCGMMDYYPNEEGVIWFARSIWPRVRQSRPDARFQIVGAKPTRAVQALAQEDASIEVTGSVPAVEPFLWKSAVSVAPLRLAQGLQNKVLEAIAAGLPAVVTPQVAAGLPQAVESACTASESADTFADAVVSLLNRSPEQRRALAASAQLSSLTWSSCLAPLESVLRNAAATR